MNQEFVESLKDTINRFCTAIHEMISGLIGYIHYLQRPPFRVINGYVYEFDMAIDDVNYKLGKIARHAAAVAAS